MKSLSALVAVMLMASVSARADPPKAAVFDLELLDASLQGEVDGPRTDEQRRLMSTGDQLRVPLPQGVPGGGEAQLRLVDASGRRELRERVPVAPGSGDGPPELVWRVPGSWLATGSYRLELMLPGAAAPLHFSFAVGGG